MNNLILKKRKKSFLMVIFSTFIFFYPSISIKSVNSSEGNILNTKCPSLKIKKFTYITFDKIEKSNLIDLNNVDCKDVVMIDKLDSSKVNIICCLIFKNILFINKYILLKSQYKNF